MRILVKIALTIVVILLIFAAVVAIKWHLLVSTPLIPMNQPAVNFIYPPHASTRALAYKLNKLNLVKDPVLFVSFAKRKGYAKKLKAGEYRVEPGMTVEMLLSKMARGEMVKHDFKIIEGWTMQQVLTALQNNQFLTHTLSGLTSDAVMQKIGREGEMPEGRFAPDTFIFSGEVKDRELLSTSYQLMQKRLVKEWIERDNNVPLKCPYETLIVASMIEKETAFSAEKPLIAGVIYNRLAKGMLLQIDPTVIYGLGANYTGKLTAQNLQAPSSYNTYLNKGLPPSPICMPGLDSIHAALHPINTTALYYVAKGDGRHQFSNTYAEQQAAIQHYLSNKK